MVVFFFLIIIDSLNLGKRMRVPLSAQMVTSVFLPTLGGDLFRMRERSATYEARPRFINAAARALQGLTQKIGNFSFYIRVIE